MNKKPNSIIEGHYSRRLSHEVFLLPLTLAIGFMGCAQKASPPVAVEASISGKYALVSVDGQNVPCTVNHQGQKVGVKSGEFLINPDARCSSKVVFTAPNGQDVTRDVDATYTVSGTHLTMHWKGAGITTGSVLNDTFTMNNEGMIFAYHK